MADFLLLLSLPAALLCIHNLSDSHSKGWWLYPIQFRTLCHTRELYWHLKKRWLHVSGSAWHIKHILSTCVPLSHNKVLVFRLFLCNIHTVNPCLWKISLLQANLAHETRGNLYLRWSYALAIVNFLEDECTHTSSSVSIEGWTCLISLAILGQFLIKLEGIVHCPCIHSLRSSPIRNVFFKTLPVS